MARIKLEPRPQRRRLTEWCSFCGAPREKVKVLVASNTKEAFICNVCIDTAAQIAHETLIAEAVAKTVNEDRPIKPAVHVEARPSARPERLTSIEDVLADVGHAFKPKEPA